MYESRLEPESNGYMCSVLENINPSSPKGGGCTKPP